MDKEGETNIHFSQFYERAYKGVFFFFTRFLFGIDKKCLVSLQLGATVEMETTIDKKKT